MLGKHDRAETVSGSESELSETEAAGDEIQDGTEDGSKG